MGILVIVAIVAVIWLAGNTAVTGTSADPNVSGLQPDGNLPALGATDKFSPALTGGRALIQRGNRVRLNTSYSNTDNTVRPSAVPATQASVGVFGGNTNQSSDGGYARQTAPRIAVRQNIGIQSGKVYQPYKF